MDASLPETARRVIHEVAQRHGARNLAVFGSFARGEPGETSDLDLLVDMEPGRSLLDLVALANELEQALDRHVDVVSRNGLSPHLRERILAEAKPV